MGERADGGSELELGPVPQELHVLSGKTFQGPVVLVRIFFGSLFIESEFCLYALFIWDPPVAS